MIRKGKSGREKAVGGYHGRRARYRRQVIAGYLQKEVPGYEPFTPSDPEHLRGVIEPGDVLLVEGNNRVSGIIKYLTQSTWSHAALFVGPIDGAAEPDGEPHVLIEANIGEGVTSAPLSKYFPYHTRLCRPVGLIVRGPLHGVPLRHQPDRLRLRHQEHPRSDALSDPAADPAALAAAHDRVRLRRSDQDHLLGADRAGVRRRALPDPAQDHPRRLAGKARREILHIRNSSLYMPRDFDISPYFEIVKPTIVHGFDYTALHWADKQKPLREVAGEFGPFPEAIESPPLVPEAIDEAAPLPAAEMIVTIETTVIERVVVAAEHHAVADHAPAGEPKRSKHEFAA